MAVHHFDELETRHPDVRARAVAARLPMLVAGAIEKAPGWARHLAGVDPAAITSREALAALPLLRRADLIALQNEKPPFGSFNTVTPGRARRILMSAGPIFEPESMEPDAYGAGRALFAAGIRTDDIVVNCFSYHLAPDAYLMESGLKAVGCAVIPGGIGDIGQQVDAIAHVQPSAYTGTPDVLKALLDHAAEHGKNVSSLKRGLVCGAALSPMLRTEFASRGIEVLQCYAIAGMGVVAYEADARGGLIVNEHVLVEIVKPGTGDPVPDGEVGELVVTSFNAAYPMIRFATGDLSAVLPGSSPCGRTNLRINGWMGHAEQTIRIRGIVVHPGQVAQVARRHRELGRVRLVVTRSGEHDQMTLLAECATPSGALALAAGESLQAATDMRGEVQLLAPGTLPNDGKMIADERPVEG